MIAVAVAVAIVKRAITFWVAIPKITIEPLYIEQTKNVQRG